MQRGPAWRMRHDVSEAWQLQARGLERHGKMCTSCRLDATGRPDAPRAQLCLGTTSRLDEPPELPLADHFHYVALGREALDLHELQAAARAGDLQHAGPTPHQHVGQTA